MNDEKEIKSNLELFESMSTRPVEFCGEICDGYDCPCPKDDYDNYGDCGFY